MSLQKRASVINGSSWTDRALPSSRHHRLWLCEELPPPRGPVHPDISLRFLRCVSSGHLDVHLHGLRSKWSVKRNYYNLQAAWDFESSDRASTIHDITLAHEYTYPTRPTEIIDAKSDTSSPAFDFADRHHYGSLRPIAGAPSYRGPPHNLPSTQTT
jgi:hypothetical protein